jgi:hypothetical protein
MNKQLPYLRFCRPNIALPVCSRRPRIRYGHHSGCTSNRRTDASLLDTSSPTSFDRLRRCRTRPSGLVIPWFLPVLGIRIRNRIRFGPPGSGSLPFLTKVLSGLKKCLQNKILTQNFSKKLNIRTEDNVPAGKVMRKKIFKKILLHSQSH